MKAYQSRQKQWQAMLDNLYSIGTVYANVGKNQTSQAQTVPSHDDPEDDYVPPS